MLFLPAKIVLRKLLNQTALHLHTTILLSLFWDIYCRGKNGGGKNSQNLRVHLVVDSAMKISD